MVRSIPTDDGFTLAIETARKGLWDFKFAMYAQFQMNPGVRVVSLALSAWPSILLELFAHHPASTANGRQPRSCTLDHHAAQSCPSPMGKDAAAQPLRPAIRCERENEAPMNSDNAGQSANSLRLRQGPFLAVIRNLCCSEQG